MKIRGPLEIQKEKLKRERDKIEKELGMKKQVGETNLAFKRRRANSPINKLKNCISLHIFWKCYNFVCYRKLFP